MKHPVENQKHLCYLLPHLSKEEQIEQAEKNRQELNNMLHSINRMLLRSTDAHGIVLTPKTFNLQEMLETVTAPDRWNTPPGKSFHIRLHFNTPDPMISGDPDFLQAVFQNLIDNSLKYSGEEAEIDITCTAPDDKHARITIKDNGQGIPSRELRHIFERYHRAQHQGDKKTKGHGWDSTNPAKSSSPTGVKSTSTALPATVQPSPSPYLEQPKDKNTNPMERQPKSHTRVLYAEDNKRTAELVQKILELHGYSVEIVPDEKAAWRAYRRERPNILLLDLDLPEVNGWNSPTSCGQKPPRHT